MKSIQAGLLAVVATTWVLGCTGENPPEANRRPDAEPAVEVVAQAHKVENGMYTHQWIAWKALELWQDNTGELVRNSGVADGNFAPGEPDRLGYLAGEGLVDGAGEEDTDMTDGDWNSKCILDLPGEAADIGPWCRHGWDPDNPDIPILGAQPRWDDGFTVWGSNYNRLVQIFEHAVALYPENPGEAYYWLGRSAHLITDLAVPAHAHLDAHAEHVLGEDGLEEYVGRHFAEFEPDAERPPYFIEDIRLPEDLVAPTTIFSLAWFVAQKSDEFASDDTSGDKFYRNSVGVRQTLPVSLWAGERATIEDDTCRLNYEDERCSTSCNLDVQFDPQCSVYATIADPLMQHAFRAVAGLYRMFWQRTHPNDTLAPTVRVNPNPVDIDTCADQGGAGFPPNTELTLVFEDLDAGVTSRESRVTTDARGNFSWAFGMNCPGADHDAALARASAYLERVDPNHVGFGPRRAQYHAEYWRGGLQHSNSVDYTLASDGSCVRACDGRVCGTDACSGSCGTCLANQSCNAQGQCVVSAAQPITRSGTLAGVEHWTLAQSPILLTGDLTITGSLTIDAGVVVMLQYDYCDIRVTTGSLTVNGTAAAPVVFTADQGSTPGLWGSIGVDSTAGPVNITWADIRYGGSTAASTNFSGHTFDVDGRARPNLANVQFTGNRLNGVSLRSQAYGADVRLNNPGVPYVLSNDLTINSGVTLTIDAGVVLKADSDYVDINVNGRLVANGTAVRPIIVTSGSDDDFGGDTHGDGRPANIERFGGIHLARDPNAAGPHELRNVVIRWGGSNAASGRSHALEVDGRTSPVFESITMAHNHYNGIALDAMAYNLDVHLDSTALPYWVDGRVTMNDNTTLTVDAGVVVKSWGIYSAEFIVNGRIVANGTPQRPVVFTSGADDRFHGDTNDNLESLVKTSRAHARMDARDTA